MKKHDFEKMLPIILLVVAFALFMFLNDIFISMLVAGIGTYYSFYTRQTVVGISNISVLVLDLTVLFISLSRMVK